MSVISRVNLENVKGLGKPPTQAFLVELLFGRDGIRAPLKTLAWETRVRDKEKCLQQRGVCIKWVCVKQGLIVLCSV